MTVDASCQNYLETVEYVVACLGVVLVLCVVARDLTDRDKTILCHSPFLRFMFWVGSK